MRKHLAWITVFLPFALMVLANFIAWPHLGDRVPVHMNLQGEVDRWGGKSSIWLLPFIQLWPSLILNLATRRASGAADPANRKAVLWLQAGLGLLFLYLHAAFLFTSFQPDRDFALNFIKMGLGVFMISLSMSFRSCQPNHVFGIRTPWTLSSPENWALTHRVGSSLLLQAGIAVAFFYHFMSMFVVLGIFLTAILATVIVSYVKRSA